MFPRPGDSAHDGAHRYLKNLRRLGVGFALNGHQGQGQPLLIRELIQCPGYSGYFPLAIGDFFRGELCLVAIFGGDDVSLHDITGPDFVNPDVFKDPVAPLGRMLIVGHTLLQQLFYCLL